MGRVLQFLKSTGRLFGQDSPRQRELKTSRALLAVFGTFSQADEEIADEEIEVSFDFVRNIFPEADHQMLGQFLEKALSKRPPPRTTARLSETRSHQSSENCFWTPAFLSRESGNGIR
ncbi:hypothetical protein N9051_00500 [Akkermansiaceae bacterium]|nr:hypothetical protein [Akkermansiaceae bacterium]